MVQPAIIGLDIGDKRIGVAVSDPLGLTAQAREVITRTTPEEDIAAIRALVTATKANRIVAGLPYSMDGTIGHQAQKVLAFIERLREGVDVRVETFDERMSTAAAKRSLSVTGARAKKRKQVVDMVAAQHILQTYLDRRSQRPEQPQP